MAISRILLRAYNCFFLIGCGFVSTANAFYTPLIVDPAQPTLGQLIHFSVTSGDCDGIIIPPFHYPTWQIQGNTIRATVDAIEYYDQAFCNLPVQTVRYSVPSVPAGSYNLELYRREIFDNDIRLVQTTQFVVGAPVAVPSASWWSLSGLAVLLAALGVYFVRRNRANYFSTGSRRAG